MIRSLSRVLSAFRLKHDLPDGEPGAATLARGLISPSNEVVAEVNEDGALVLNKGQADTLESLGWVGGVLPESLGGTGQSSRPYCSVKAGSVQSFASGEDQIVNLDTVETDPDGIWDSATKRGTLPRSGFICVTATFAGELAAWFLRVKINGGTTYILSEGYVYGRDSYALQIPVEAGDYIELWCQQFTGETHNSLANEPRLGISYAR